MSGDDAKSGELDLSTFIRNIEAQFDQSPPVPLEAGTRLRELPDWTSLQALVVVASFDWDYGVTISADEFRSAETIAELHELVAGKMS